MAAPSHRSPLPVPPPEAWAPLRRLAALAARPVEAFLRIEAASGLLLLAAAAVALALANSPLAAAWAALWETPLAVQFGAFSFERSLAWVVNDGLMVIFFFVVGLEIRRELHDGELSEWRRASLPAAAALGGMLVPAGLYLLFAGAAETRSGWGVPMATDIAFAVGVLTLLGPRVPPALRVLLLALAVIDDLGAILVIAIFYSSGVAPLGFAVASGGLAAIFVMQRIGVRAKAAYVLPGLVVWGGIYAGGVHPTIAGVVLGLVTPVRAWLGADGFVRGVREELDRLPAERTGTAALTSTLHYVRLAEREAVSPAEGLIHLLHPWVAFGIMPIFALANAGVVVTGDTLGNAFESRVTAGIVFGLVLGKPIGIFLFAVIALRAGIASLPVNVGYVHLWGAGMLAGIGFTVSLFITGLAYSDGALVADAKMGVLGASLIAGTIAFVYLWIAPGEPEPEATSNDLALDAG